MGAKRTPIRSREPQRRAAAAGGGPHRELGGRFGLTVPHEWWGSAPLLKSFEAAGFGLVQIDAPPSGVLRDPRLLLRHAEAVRSALETTELRLVIHAPSGLRAGTREGDRAMAGLLDYAAELGSELVVYHALAMPDEGASEGAARAELRALKVFARYAASIGAVIAVENLAPIYPGPETLSAMPMTLRTLVRKLDSEGVGLCLDLGHANITAELRGTDLPSLVEPVLDQVVLVHAHDNLGARRRNDRELRGVDPLRLDLHLPPGRGTLPWARIAPLLDRLDAPIVWEVHPPHRHRASELYAAGLAALEQR